VFEDAYDENGPMSFIVGNFGMHMFPAVAVYALADRADVYCGKDNVVIQCNLALAVSLVRTLPPTADVLLIQHNPTDPLSFFRYGCTLKIPCKCTNAVYLQ